MHYIGAIQNTRTGEITVVDVYHDIEDAIATMSSNCDLTESDVWNTRDDSLGLSAMVAAFDGGDALAIIQPCACGNPDHDRLTGDYR